MAKDDMEFRERPRQARSSSSSSPASANSPNASIAQSHLILCSNEDLSEDEHEASKILQQCSSIQRIGTPRELHTYTPWATHRCWVYIEREEERERQPDELGIPKFVRPCGYVHPTNKRTFKSKPGLEPAAAYVIATRSISEDPFATYDKKHNRYLISPHAHPYVDLRNDPNHPDYLPPEKLCQYQACEIFGYPVWRHDRQFLRCSLPSCHTVTVDHDVTTQICHGCGPKSKIRYCSKDHLLQDVDQHWKECGDVSKVLRRFIDEGSQPDRFYRRYPAITDISNKRSYEKHRQRTHAILKKGQYTLFIGRGYQRVVEWPEELVSTYKPRVERLLNIALFDQSQDRVIRYLYCLLRFCLRHQNLWTKEISFTLSTQFKLEFGWNYRVAFDEDPCQCVWLGDSADPMKCAVNCKQSSSTVGIICRGNGLKFLVERLEAQHWMLRIWQRQHPEVKGWRARLYGVGFNGVPESQNLTAGMVTVMGKGWHGWGSVGYEAGLWRKPDQPNEFIVVKDEADILGETEEEK